MNNKQSKIKDDEYEEEQKQQLNTFKVAESKPKDSRKQIKSFKKSSLAIKEKEKQKEENTSLKDIKYSQQGKEPQTKQRTKSKEFKTKRDKDADEIQAIKDEIASFEQLATSQIPERKRKSKIKKDSFRDDSYSLRTPNDNERENNTSNIFPQAENINKNLNVGNSSNKHINSRLLSPNFQQSPIEIRIDEDHNQEEKEDEGIYIDESEHVLDSIKQIKQQMLSQLNALDSKNRSEGKIPPNIKLSQLSEPQKEYYDSALKDQSRDDDISPQNPVEQQIDESFKEGGSNKLNFSKISRYYTEEEVNEMVEKIEKNLSQDISFRNNENKSSSQEQSDSSVNELKIKGNEDNINEKEDVKKQKKSQISSKQIQSEITLDRSSTNNLLIEANQTHQRLISASDVNKNSSTNLIEEKKSRQQLQEGEVQPKKSKQSQEQTLKSSQVEILYETKQEQKQQQQSQLQKQQQKQQQQEQQQQKQQQQEQKQKSNDQMSQQSQKQQQTKEQMKQNVIQSSKQILSSQEIAAVNQQTIKNASADSQNLVSSSMNRSQSPLSNLRSSEVQRQKEEFPIQNQTNIQQRQISEGLAGKNVISNKNQTVTTTQKSTLLLQQILPLQQLFQSLQQQQTQILSNKESSSREGKQVESSQTKQDGRYQRVEAQINELLKSRNPELFKEMDPMDFYKGILMRQEKIGQLSQKEVQQLEKDIKIIFELNMQESIQQIAQNYSSAQQFIEEKTKLSEIENSVIKLTEIEKDTKKKIQIEQEKLKSLKGQQESVIQEIQKEKEQRQKEQQLRQQKVEQLEREELILKDKIKNGEDKLSSIKGEITLIEDQRKKTKQEIDEINKQIQKKQIDMQNANIEIQQKILKGEDQKAKEQQQQLNQIESEKLRDLSAKLKQEQENSFKLLQQLQRQQEQQDKQLIEKREQKQQVEEVQRRSIQELKLSTIQDKSQYLPSQQYKEETQIKKAEEVVHKIVSVNPFLQIKQEQAGISQQNLIGISKLIQSEIKQDQYQLSSSPAYSILNTNQYSIQFEPKQQHKLLPQTVVPNDSTFNHNQSSIQSSNFFLPSLSNNLLLNVSNNTISPQNNYLVNAVVNVDSTQNKSITKTSQPLISQEQITKMSVDYQPYQQIVNIPVQSNSYQLPKQSQIAQQQQKLSAIIDPQSQNTLPIQVGSDSKNQKELSQIPNYLTTQSQKSIINPYLLNNQATLFSAVESSKNVSQQTQPSWEINNLSYLSSPSQLQLQQKEITSQNIILPQEQSKYRIEDVKFDMKVSTQDQTPKLDKNCVIKTNVLQGIQSYEPYVSKPFQFPLPEQITKAQIVIGNQSNIKVPNQIENIHLPFTPIENCEFTQIKKGTQSSSLINPIQGINNSLIDTKSDNSYNQLTKQKVEKSDSFQPSNQSNNINIGKQDVKIFNSLVAPPISQIPASNFSTKQINPQNEIQKSLSLNSLIPIQQTNNKNEEKSIIIPSIQQAHLQPLFQLPSNLSNFTVKSTTQIQQKQTFSPLKDSIKKASQIEILQEAQPSFSQFKLNLSSQFSPPYLQISNNKFPITELPNSNSVTQSFLFQEGRRSQSLGKEIERGGQQKQLSVHFIEKNQEKKEIPQYISFFSTKNEYPKQIVSVPSETEKSTHKSTTLPEEFFAQIQEQVKKALKKNECHRNVIDQAKQSTQQSSNKRSSSLSLPKYDMNSVNITHLNNNLTESDQPGSPRFAHSPFTQESKISQVSNQITPNKEILVSISDLPPLNDDNHEKSANINQEKNIVLDSQQIKNSTNYDLPLPFKIAISTPPKQILLDHSNQILSLPGSPQKKFKIEGDYFLKITGNTGQYESPPLKTVQLPSTETLKEESIRKLYKSMEMITAVTNSQRKVQFSPIKQQILQLPSPQTEDQIVNNLNKQIHFSDSKKSVVQTLPENQTSKLKISKSSNLLLNSNFNQSYKLSEIPSYNNYKRNENTSDRLLSNQSMAQASKLPTLDTQIRVEVDTLQLNKSRKNYSLGEKNYLLPQKSEIESPIKKVRNLSVEPIQGKESLSLNQFSSQQKITIPFQYYKLTTSFDNTNNNNKIENKQRYCSQSPSVDANNSKQAFDSLNSSSVLNKQMEYNLQQSLKLPASHSACSSKETYNFPKQIPSKPQTEIKMSQYLKERTQPKQNESLQYNSMPQINNELKQSENINVSLKSLCNSPSISVEQSLILNKVQISPPKIETRISQPLNRIGEISTIQVNKINTNSTITTNQTPVQSQIQSNKTSNSLVDVEYALKHAKELVQRWSKGDQQTKEYSRSSSLNINLLPSEQTNQTNEPKSQVIKEYDINQKVNNLNNSSIVKSSIMEEKKSFDKVNKIEPFLSSSISREKEQKSPQIIIFATNESFEKDQSQIKNIRSTSKIDFSMNLPIQISPQQSQFFKETLKNIKDTSTSSQIVISLNQKEDFSKEKIYPSLISQAISDIDKKQKVKSQASPQNSCHENQNLPTASETNKIVSKQIINENQNDRSSTISPIQKEVENIEEQSQKNENDKQSTISPIHKLEVKIKEQSQNYKNSLQLNDLLPIVQQESQLKSPFSPKHIEILEELRRQQIEREEKEIKLTIQSIVQKSTTAASASQQDNLEQQEDQQLPKMKFFNKQQNHPSDNSQNSFKFLDQQTNSDLEQNNNPPQQNEYTFKKEEEEDDDQSQQRNEEDQTDPIQQNQIYFEDHQHESENNSPSYPQRTQHELEEYQSSQQKKQSNSQDVQNYEQDINISLPQSQEQSSYLSPIKKSQVFICTNEQEMNASFNKAFSLNASPLLQSKEQNKLQQNTLSLKSSPLQPSKQQESIEQNTFSLNNKNMLPLKQQDNFNPQNSVSLNSNPFMHSKQQDNIQYNSFSLNSSPFVPSKQQESVDENIFISFGIESHSPFLFNTKERKPTVDHNIERKQISIKEIGRNQVKSQPTSQEIRSNNFQYIQPAAYKPLLLSPVYEPPSNKDSAIFDAATFLGVPQYHPITLGSRCSSLDNSSTYSRKGNIISQQNARASSQLPQSRQTSNAEYNQYTVSILGSQIFKQSTQSVVRDEIKNERNSNACLKSQQQDSFGLDVPQYTQTIIKNINKYSTKQEQIIVETEGPIEIEGSDNNESSNWNPNVSERQNDQPYQPSTHKQTRIPIVGETKQTIPSEPDSDKKKKYQDVSAILQFDGQEDDDCNLMKYQTNHIEIEQTRNIQTPQLPQISSSQVKDSKSRSSNSLHSNENRLLSIYSLPIQNCNKDTELQYIESMNSQILRINTDLINRDKQIWETKDFIQKQQSLRITNEKRGSFKGNQIASDTPSFAKNSFSSPFLFSKTDTHLNEKKEQKIKGLLSPSVSSGNQLKNNLQQEQLSHVQSHSMLPQANNRSRQNSFTLQQQTKFTVVHSPNPGSVSLVKNITRIISYSEPISQTSQANSPASNEKSLLESQASLYMLNPINSKVRSPVRKQINLSRVIVQYPSESIPTSTIQQEYYKDKKIQTSFQEFKNKGQSDTHYGKSQEDQKKKKNISPQPVHVNQKVMPQLA